LTIVINKNSKKNYFMDYADYAGLDVKIIAKDGHHCEVCVFGFMFENPESEVVLEN
jgi:hypothetical protein